eukprot:1523029-Amphidinium_carterae.1
MPLPSAWRSLPGSEKSRKHREEVSAAIVDNVLQVQPKSAMHPYLQDSACVQKVISLLSCEPPPY